MTVRVRRARFEDVPWMLEQLQAFSDFFGTTFPIFPADQHHAEARLEGLIHNHPFYVATCGDAPHSFPVGLIAGALAPHHYNPKLRQLTEMFWWVDPNYRGSRAGSMLLDAFLEEGRQRAHWIVMTLEHNSPVKDETLTRRGFKHMSRDFLLETGLLTPEQAEVADALSDAIRSAEMGVES